MDERETIIKVTTILEGLVLEVKGLSTKIDTLKDGHVQDTNTAIEVLRSQVADMKEQTKKIPTLETNLAEMTKQRDSEKNQKFYLWLAVASEGLAIIGAVIVYFTVK